MKQLLLIVVILVSSLACINCDNESSGEALSTPITNYTAEEAKDILCKNVTCAGKANWIVTYIPRSEVITASGTRDAYWQIEGGPGFKIINWYLSNGIWYPRGTVTNDGIWAVREKTGQAVAVNDQAQNYLNWRGVKQ